MEKDEAIDRFLTALRAAFNYISLYSRSHRTFLAAIRRLREHLEGLFPLLDPVDIGFTPEALNVDGKSYDKLPLHKELARIFHSRKVKSIRFSPGVTDDELVLVLDTLSQPVRELVKTHALGRMVAEGRTPHFSAEELDYSNLLKEEGDEGADIWTYLLRNIMDEKDARKVDEFLASFESMVGRIKAKDLIEDEQLRKNVQQLLGYIKDKDAEKFAICSAELLRSFINDRSLVPDARVGSLRDFFAGLDTEVLSSVLWDSVSADEQFDTRSLEIFSLLVERDQHEKIADTLVKHAGKDRSSRVDMGRMKKMRDIFSPPKGELASSYIPDIYRKAIMTISDSQSFGRGYSFNRFQLQASYHNILLCMLSLENDPEQRGSIFARILAVWDELMARIDTGYLLALAQSLKTSPEGEGAAADLARKLRAFVEQGAWFSGFPPELRELALSFDGSVLGKEAYLKAIFGEPLPDPFIIKLFFKLLPEAADEFYAAAEKRSSDFEFMSWLIGGAKGAEGASGILRMIFSFSNDLVKIEAVRAMAELPGADKEFLFSLLSGGNYFLKKEVLPILMKGRWDEEKALSALLLVRNPWGRNNRLLLENLSIIEEIDCRDAVEYLRVMARKNFLFNSIVVRKAKEILEKWHA